MMLPALNRIVSTVYADGPTQPTPTFNGPLSSILTTVGGWAAGILLIGGVLTIVVGAILLITGSLTRHPEMKSWGWKVVIISAVAVIIGGSAAGIVALAQGLKVTN